MLNDTIDVTFWHYDSVSAGEYSVVLHKIAGTVYQISLKQTINESLITTTSNTGMTSTDRVIFGIDMFILFVILVPILRRKRN
jgi:hypothetical protein